MPDALSEPSLVEQLLLIEQKMRCCETITELNFVMVNLTRSLVPYEQAAYLVGNELERLKLMALSDLSIIDRSTPFCAWLEEVALREDRSEFAMQPHVIDISDLPKELSHDINTFSPPNILWQPLIIPSKPNQRVGVLMIAKSQSWTSKEIGLLQHLALSYAHAMQVFTFRTGWQYWRKKIFSKYVSLLLLSGAVLVSFVPVRLTVLAPAEILAKDSFLVTSSIAGAVSEILVTPGETIEQGETLVLLDKTELQGRYDVAQRELERTRAELRTAEQAGYIDRRRNSELAELKSQVELKVIELDYLEQKLGDTKILAHKSGVVVLNDPEKWKGRPVVIGERIISIADPEKIQLEVMLPVKDAISLNNGNDVTLYLDIDPLNPISFTVDYSSFEPSLTPDQIVAYRIIASRHTSDSATQTPENVTQPRIGLRGTAKLYGETVSLAYYLFRRPITFIRQSLGV